jgi:hypothetical protein
MPATFPRGPKPERFMPLPPILQTQFTTPSTALSYFARRLNGLRVSKIFNYETSCFGDDAALSRPGFSWGRSAGVMRPTATARLSVWLTYSTGLDMLRGMLVKLRRSQAAEVAEAATAVMEPLL